MCVTCVTTIRFLTICLLIYTGSIQFAFSSGEQWESFPMRPGEIGALSATSIVHLPVCRQPQVIRALSTMANIRDQLAPLCTDWLLLDYTHPIPPEHAWQDIRNTAIQVVRCGFASSATCALIPDGVSIRFPEDFDDLLYGRIDDAGHYTHRERDGGGNTFYLPFHTMRSPKHYQLFYEPGDTGVTIRIPIFHHGTYVADFGVSYKFMDDALDR